jgi:hypothetical protein
MARTAVVAGTATAVSNRVSRRQAGRWADQDQQQAYAQQEAYQQQADQQPPPAPAAPSTDDRLEQLKQLGELKASGVLTEQEFEEQKRQILGT